MSPKEHTNSECQHKNSRGQRCHMLIDENHRPANGAGRPTLCAYHVSRLKAAVPVVDPEVLAAELLGDIDSFTTADEVNLFLGNLVRQLARKRISRRDAIALAYISQLILTSQTAMAKEIAAESETEDLGRYLLKGLGSPRSTPQDELSATERGAAACPDVGNATGPRTDGAPPIDRFAGAG